ncbi:hypothetical protein B0T16DRAFT_339079 [Cercophora newfieldiana]|uniref:Uncharacterized protein n=1 Tax=Cercophora newfieldiana TaxID=92897 RepID=A0AA39XTI0_9PEZI|nr:hypothetical protein B0T16DRAFT_339079 [Cercophora newfieldiana]
MSTITLSTHVTSTFLKGLNTLSHVLDVAESHAAATGADLNNDYLPARLIDDMRPLSFQIQNVTKNVKAVLDRLTGATGEDAKPWQDTEKTWEEFRGRIEKAKAYIEGVDKTVIDERADRGEEIDHPWGPTLTVRITGRDSALNQGIPNFYFHLATAYAILRSKGVPVGKKDWIVEFFKPAQIPTA